MGTARWRAAWLVAWVMVVAVMWPGVAAAQPNEVEVYKDPSGMKLQVDGKDFMVFGMNWGHIPIGENYAYDLWTQDEELIKRVLDHDMKLLSEMGVNTLRSFSMIPPKWVEYIYDNYGIMTAINHLMGRYGFTVDGAFVPNTDYSDPAARKAILDDIKATVERYKNTRGLVMFLIGNENNYGLQWTSFEIEDVPDEVEDGRAVPLYTLWCESAKLVSDLDPNHPVAIVNGDLQYLNLVKRYCGALDIMGSNMYRGMSAGDAFARVDKELGMPFMFTEFGSDAYNAREEREDDAFQARYLKGNWKEIYEQAYGNGGAGNAIGGMIFQWSDEWWKYRQTVNLDVHDETSSWYGGGYDDFKERGSNNMNEEWWGIATRNPRDDSGFSGVTPRTAYYVLKEAFELDPYAASTTREVIDAHYRRISINEKRVSFLATQNKRDIEMLKGLRVSQVRLFFDASVSQGTENTERGTPVRSGHTEAYWTEFSFQRGSALSGRLSIHGVGNVANNRLDNVFYEQRALELVADPEESVEQFGGINDRFAIYQAEFKIDQPRYDLEGFYRTGRDGWGYEGDFFNLYPEAYYGANLDIYNGVDPLGMMFTGKKELAGLKIAAGPALWWGANPSVLAKFQRNVKGTDFAIIHHEDISQRQGSSTSFVIPVQVNRRSSISLARQAGSWKLEAGGLMSGSPRIGDQFTYVRETDTPGAAYGRSEQAGQGYEVFTDEIGIADTFGGRARATYRKGSTVWYTQGSLMGLVADGGWNYTVVGTGWQLKESGAGNHWGLSSGASFRAGPFEIAPKVLYHEPLIGANPIIEDAYFAEQGLYFPAVRPRNVLDDPFTVLDNRETLAGEMLIVFDPTPGSWFHAWNREFTEDSKFSAMLDVWYKRLPTQRDSNLLTLANGSIVPFGQAPPPADEWQATFISVFNPTDALRLSSSLFVGRKQPRNFVARAANDLAYGLSGRLWWKNYHATARVALNDWGPFDFHQDFNLIYPFQAYLDGSWGLRPVGMEVSGTRIGTRAQVRTLDERSLDYLPPAVGTAMPLGLEWEVGLYANIEL